MTSYRHNGAMRGASGAETAAHIEGWYEGEPLTPIDTGRKLADNGRIRTSALAGGGTGG